MKDKNLDSFLENVINEAQESYKRNIEELEKLQREKVEKAEDEILNGVYSQIQSNIFTIKHSANRDISDKTAQTRRELLLRREQITNKVFDNVKQRLEEFTKKPEYIDFLKNKLAECNNKDVTVYCRECDVEKVKGLGFEKAVADDKIKIGGVIIEQSKAVRVNQTLDVKLEEQYEYFNFVSGISIV